MLTTCRRNSLLLNLFIKLAAMCRMQYIEYARGGFHALPESLITDFMDSCRSDIKHIPGSLTTYLCKLSRKNDHASFVSPSTMAKAIGTMFRLPSYATANSNGPLYFPYKNVPSIWTTGLQKGKPSMQDLNVQKSLWKIPIP